MSENNTSILLHLNKAYSIQLTQDTLIDINSLINNENSSAIASLDNFDNIYKNEETLNPDFYD